MKKLRFLLILATIALAVVMTGVTLAAARATRETAVSHMQPVQNNDRPAAPLIRSPLVKPARLERFSDRFDPTTAIEVDRKNYITRMEPRIPEIDENRDYSTSRSNSPQS